jgi:hypothetical protein
MMGLINRLRKSWSDWYIEPPAESPALKRRRRHVAGSSILCALCLLLVQSGYRSFALPFLFFVFYALWAHWTYWRGKWASEGWHGGKLLSGDTSPEKRDA